MVGKKGAEQLWMGHVLTMDTWHEHCWDYLQLCGFWNTCTKYKLNYNVKCIDFNALILWGEEGVHAVEIEVPEMFHYRHSMKVPLMCIADTDAGTNKWKFHGTSTVEVPWDFH